MYLQEQNYAVLRNFSETYTERIEKISENGQSQREVSKRFDISQIIALLIWTRFWETSRYTRRPGQGVHRMKTPHRDRYISLNALRSRVATVRPIEMDFRRGTGVQFSDQMTRNRLNEDNLGARMSACPPYYVSVTPQRPHCICLGPFRVACTPLAYSTVHGQEQVQYFDT